uniref:Reverse transcriptase zinc-binding domain-containing protein n=1 Tax=Myripristis murdjan TaxID=586833 RepID=A0A667XHY3_9TELE
MSNCVRYKVIQLNLLHRVYITPFRLKKMDHTLSNLCWHGCGEVGTLLHSLWSCPAVKALWEKVGEILSKLLSVDVDLHPATCLLGMPQQEIHDMLVQSVPEKHMYNIITVSLLVFLKWWSLGFMKECIWCKTLKLYM